MNVIDALAFYGPRAFALLAIVTLTWLLIEAHRAPLDPWDDASRPNPEPLDTDWRWPR